MFKSRVKIVRDEEVVKKWVEEQSFKTEYVCLNVPEPLKLPSMEEVEKHFRATHKETIIKSVESHTVAGVPSRSLRCRELLRLVRSDWEQQRLFSAANRDGLEPAVRRARPAIFQGQQDRHARRRRATAFPRSRNHAGVRRHQAHRAIHQRESEVHAEKID